MVISLFQTDKTITNRYSLLSPIKYHYSLFIRCQLAKSNWCVSGMTSRTFARNEDVDDVTYSANVT